MAKAQASSEAVRVRVTKAPPDGFAVLRKLTYGETLDRQELSGGMSAPIEDRGRPKELQFDMGLAETTMFDFTHCILEHNLEKDNGTLFDLKNIDDVRLLDPAVGTELADLINHLNDGDDMAPFLVKPGSASATVKASPAVHVAS